MALTEWLSILHGYFLDQKPFVIATITAYGGSSPNRAGVALFYSRQRSHNMISSEVRHRALVATANRLLSSPTAHYTEQLELGKIAGTNNGCCDVTYEYFDGKQYPRWLTELRQHHKEGITCALIREFDNADHNRVIRTEVQADTAANTGIELFNTNAECVALTNSDSTTLIRLQQNKNIAVTLIGDHPVADEIEKQCLNLPITITRQSSDTTQVASTDIAIIMTSDHDLDFQLCKSALTQPGEKHIKLIGCLGSKRKAEIFRSRLLQSDIKQSALEQFHMPVGIAAIKGKQNSVVAASIIAQVLAQHQW